jgi:hypothetical protein
MDISNDMLSDASFLNIKFETQSYLLFYSVFLLKQEKCMHERSQLPVMD